MKNEVKCSLRREFRALVVMAMLALIYLLGVLSADKVVVIVRGLWVVEQLEGKAQ